MNYRFLTTDGYKTFNTYRAAKHSRDQLVDHGMRPQVIETNCIVHGWQFTTWGACSECQAALVLRYKEEI